VAINQIAVDTANVEPETPSPRQGEMALNPNPVPRANMMREAADATKAPAMTAPHDVAERPCDWGWTVPGSSARVVTMASMSLSSAVGAHREQQDDWQGNTQHPKQNSATHDSVSFKKI
jgi:hypothetical protein